MSTRVYNIVPTQNSSYECPVSSCLTLSQFAQNIMDNIALNTTLIISGGIHILNVGVSVSHNTKFVMMSTNNSNHTSSPVIKCAERANFEFTNISVVHLNGLSLKECNNSRFQFIHKLVIENSAFIESKSPITLADSTANFIGTNFYFNLGSYTSSSELLDRLSENPDLALIASLGGALMVTRSIIAVKNCNFVRNTANFGGAIYSEINSSIIITDSNFLDNHAC